MTDASGGRAATSAEDGNYSPTILLSRELVRRRSVTPEDAGCQKLIADRLQVHGFAADFLPFGDVTNVWLRRGTQAPLFVFAGHTDVVPPGPEENWTHPPFEATVQNGILHGRGSADMKTGIAAMTTAVERFVAAHPQHSGSIALLLTSDEEGAAINGTVKVVETLQQRNERIDYCLVGEATSQHKVADTIKNGRRGSLGAKLKIKGVQGHVAYPDRALNPIHAFSRALSELCSEQWDNGNEFFSPTTLQFSNVHSGTGADNVIPGELEAMFNFRFSSAITAQQLQQRTEDILRKHQLEYDVQWRVSGLPFLTEPGTLTSVVSDAVREITGYSPELSTTGGTSDARFIAPTGAQVIEIGLVNATIHKVNEHASIADIDTLSTIYERVLIKLLARP
jgi:succinyl-diaminopimelate desuccinylase